MKERDIFGIFLYIATERRHTENRTAWMEDLINEPTSFDIDQFFYNQPFFLFHTFQWLAIVSIAVLYNIIFVVGRAIFWEINKKATFLWYILDYLCDFIYFLDTIVHCHEGEL